MSLDETLRDGERIFKIRECLVATLDNLAVFPPCKEKEEVLVEKLRKNALQLREVISRYDGVASHPSEVLENIERYAYSILPEDTADYAFAKDLILDEVKGKY